MMGNNQSDFSQNITLEDIATQLNGLQSLFARRLSEDRVTKRLVQNVNASLERRDDADRRTWIAPMLRELLLAVDRLQTNDAQEGLATSVADEILTIFERYGIVPIENDGGLNPHCHEIVGVRPAQPDALAGTIVDVVRTGYRFGDTILRPARVIVTK